MMQCQVFLTNRKLTITDTHLSFSKYIKRSNVVKTYTTRPLKYQNKTIQATQKFLLTEGQDEDCTSAV